MKKLSKLNSELFSNQELNKNQKSTFKGGGRAGERTITFYNEYPGGPLLIAEDIA